jgi:hypothetical protein
MPLRRIGYWRQVGRYERGDHSDYLLSNPCELVDPTWNPDIKRSVVTYLRNGKVLACCMGYSYCRFHCGISDNMMGSCELTDGVWLWPEGLPHYVEVHSVRLPADFINHMQRQDFKPPNHLDGMRLRDAYGDELALAAHNLYEQLRKG